MKTSIVLMAVALLCTVTFAEPVNMPSKGALKEAKPVIEGLVEAGTTAEELLAMAEETDNGAERYYLYRHAYILQAKAGKYDEAAEIINVFQTEVSGVPASDIVSLIEKHSGKKAKDIPQLTAALKMAKAKVTAEGQVFRVKKELKKTPGDTSLRLQLAEALAIMGNWPEALNEFKKVGGGTDKMAEKEVKGDIDSKLAAFWWDYSPKNKSAASSFKAHAIELYSKLLEEGQLSALEKALAEKRVVGAEELGAVSTTKSVDSPSVRIIANANGLVHRWTFNDTLEDEYSKYGKAGFYGNATISNGCAHLFGGKCPEENNIFLHGRSIPNDGSQITIEMWATQNKVERFARILTFGRRKGSRVEITWGLGDDLSGQQVMVSHGYWKDGVHLAPFTLGEEFHIAFVFSYKADLKAKNNKIWYLTGYKQDAKTGRTIAKFQVELEEGFTLKDFPVDLFHLGWSYSNNDYSANASYNEVRIWKRALSEGELTDNAKRFYKAGETMKK